MLVEGTQHANGSQELRHQVLVATADTVCERERERESKYLISGQGHHNSIVTFRDV